MIQNHFFLGVDLEDFFGALVFGAFFWAGFLAIGLVLVAPLVAFLVEAFFGLAGDLAGEVVAAGVVAGAGVVAAGVVAAGVEALTTFGFLLAFGLAVLAAVLAAFGWLFEALLFDADLFCVLAIFIIINYI